MFFLFCPLPLMCPLKVRDRFPLTCSRWKVAPGGGPQRVALIHSGLMDAPATFPIRVSPLPFASSDVSAQSLISVSLEMPPVIGTCAMDPLPSRPATSRECGGRRGNGASASLVLRGYADRQCRHRTGTENCKRRWLPESRWRVRCGISMAACRSQR